MVRVGAPPEFAARPCRGNNRRRFSRAISRLTAPEAGALAANPEKARLGLIRVRNILASNVLERSAQAREANVRQISALGVGSSTVAAHPEQCSGPAGETLDAKRLLSQSSD